MSRNIINRWVVFISIGLAIVSLFLGWQVSTEVTAPNASWGSYIVGFWTIAPPIYFWFDWAYLCEGSDKTTLDQVKTTHDLSRNIWVALVALLTVMFKLKVLGMTASAGVG